MFDRELWQSLPSGVSGGVSHLVQNSVFSLERNVSSIPVPEGVAISFLRAMETVLSRLADVACWDSLPDTLFGCLLVFSGCPADDRVQSVIIRSRLVHRIVAYWNTHEQFSNSLSILDVSTWPSGSALVRVYEV